MFMRRKWLLPSIVTLFILTFVLSFSQDTAIVQPVTKVPLSGGHSTKASEFNPEHVLLAFTKGTSRQQQSLIEGLVQAHEVRSLGTDNVYLVTVPSGHVLDAIQILHNQAGVRYAEPDFTEVLAGVPNDPSFPIQWGYQNTGQTVNGTAGIPGADEAVTPAWNVTTGSKSIVIAEVDTGVDYTHPDLAANIWSNPGNVGGCPIGTHGYNVLNATCNPMDDEVGFGGHGTHVAGIMGAKGNNGVGVTGVNWNTTILPVKWVGSDGLGATSDLITALNWVITAKQAGVNIRVVNDSMTYIGTSYSQALSDEIDLLGQNGILFVTAAGNTGDNNDVLAVRRYPCGYDRPTEICVAASDQSDNLPTWANYGPQTVDLAAPGNNIYSTLRNNSYGFINGSSMSSPQVAGAAALILSVANMTPTQLKADIVNNVDQIPSMQGRLISGGRLNICKALPGCILPIAVPNVKLSQTSLSFGNQNLNTSSAAQTVTLTNNGSAALTINSIAAAGTNAADFTQTNTCALSPSTMAAGASCTISVTFKPGANGSRSASITITDNASGSPHSITLSGTGITPAPAVSLSATSFTFNNQGLGTTSVAQTSTLTNSGNSALTINSIVLSGSNVADFIETTTCPISPATLAAGANCTITVSFKPGSVGSRSASVIITDNASGSPHSIAMSGTGITAGIYFTDGFETGDFSKWNIDSSDSTGKYTVQSAVVNNGNYAASFVTGSGQYTYIYTALTGGAQTQTFTRFYFRYTGLNAGTQLALGRNANGSNVWEIDYNASRHGLDIYIWDGSNNIYALASPDNALSTNVWYSIEIQDTQTTAGHAEAWINGVSVGSVNANLSTTLPYARLMLFTSDVSTIYFDDVQVGNAYNGPANPQPGASLNTANVSFGNQNVGTTSASQSVTLTNNGAAALTINSIALSGANSADFAQTTTCPISPSTLAIGGNCTISVTFTPGASGNRAATITINDNAANSPQSIALSGTGVAPAPAVNLSAASLLFGNQNVGTTSASQSVTLTNNGAAALTINSITVSGTNATDFTETSTCPISPATLALGANCAINVTFTPGANGNRVAAVTINDNAANSPQSFALGGTGVTLTPGASLSTASLTFGSQNIGTTSAAQTITLTNNGSAPLSISIIALSGANLTDFTQTTTCPISPSTLALGANCTINVTFTPGANGARTASISITDNAPGSPQSVSLSGTGVTPAPGVSLSATTLAFGNQNMGTTSAVKTVTLTNNGTAALSISIIALSGTNLADFAQTTTCPISPSTLAIGANCTISVTFTPSAAGSRTASLSITDNAVGSPQSVGLSGTGVTVAPSVTLNTNALSFANQNVGVASTAQTITLTNTGNAPLSISGITITGTNASDYSQTNTCPISPSTLAAGGNCTINVIFKPGAAGTRVATLNITDNATTSPQSVALNGSGVSAGVYFSDGFETGDFSKWTNNSSDSTGKYSVQKTIVNTGTYAASFLTSSGQYTYISTALSGPQTQTFTRFYFRFSGLMTSTQLAIGRNTNGTNAWEIDYNASRHGLDIYFWDGANQIYSLASPDNALSTNVWYSIEIQDTQTATGHGEAWINGVSVGSFNANLATVAPYAQLMFYDDAVGTEYFDDVIVSNIYN